MRVSGNGLRSLTFFYLSSSPSLLAVSSRLLLTQFPNSAESSSPHLRIFTPPARSPARRQTTCSSYTTTPPEAGSNPKSSRTDHSRSIRPVRVCTMRLRELSLPRLVSRRGINVTVLLAICSAFAFPSSMSLSRRPRLARYARLPRSLFEGMKAYRSAKPGSKPVLFRPEMNMARMRRSAARVRLPVCPDAFPSHRPRKRVDDDADWFFRCRTLMEMSLSS